MRETLIKKSINLWLSGRWRIRAFFASLEMRKAVDDLAAHAKLDTNLVAAMHHEHEARDMGWIFAKLRRFPYWQHGHKLVAQAALHSGSAALAYGSARAMEKLATNESDLTMAKQIIARSLLQSGEANRALNILNEIGTQLMSHAIKEDIAACHLALQSYREAYAVLSDIGEKQLSISAREAYQFLKTKIND